MDIIIRITLLILIVGIVQTASNFGTGVEILDDIIKHTREIGNSHSIIYFVLLQHTICILSFKILY